MLKQARKLPLDNERFQYLRKRFQYLFKTTRAILQSPAVRGFLIGITATPIARRSVARRVGFPNFVILATGFTPEKGLEIEAALWTDFVDHKKYNEHHRNLPYRPNIGGTKRYKKTRAYVIYLTWW
jgi:hypothetical protein